MYIFNEENEDLMKEISAVSESIIRSYFIENNLYDHFYVSSVHELDNVMFNKFYKIVIENMFSYYQTKTENTKWKEEKNNEMRTHGLVYLWLKNFNNLNNEMDTVVGFISFKLVNEDFLVLYLYEIQIDFRFRYQGFGTELINLFHFFPKLFYKKSHKILNQEVQYYFENLKGFKLTVFSNNHKALNWYLSLDYKYSHDSPTDKILRNNKIIKPKYYNLIKNLC